MYSVHIDNVRQYLLLHYLSKPNANANESNVSSIKFQYAIKRKSQCCSNLFMKNATCLRSLWIVGCTFDIEVLVTIISLYFTSWSASCPFFQLLADIIFPLE